MEDRTTQSSIDADSIQESSWVSPEVSAAEAGQKVEMGKTLLSNEELEKINNPE